MAIEGICFSLKDVFEVIRCFGDVEKVYANGGFLRSREWVPILAEVLGVDIYTLDNFESSITGAFILGLLAAGKIRSLDQANKFVKICERFCPDEKNKKLYNDLFLIYKEAVRRLMPVLERL